MIDRLRKRREELQTALRETAVQLEQIRGALALCEQLIIEAEGDGALADPLPKAFTDEKEAQGR
jgi:hypothetical protein